MPPSAPLRVVVAGGGTGGHLFPGLAVAHALVAARPDVVVTFVGTARGLEARIVPKEGFALDLIRSRGLKGKRLLDVWRGAWRLPVSVVDAWRVLSNRRPDLVIGVGGYSSGPVVLLAALRGIPTMVLEQNAVPGLTNRLLAPVVRAAAVTYESTRRYFGEKAFVSGNPVRAEFLTPSEHEDGQHASGASDPPVQLLVFGGSQGAHAINRAMCDAAPLVARQNPHTAVTHQTGDRDVEAVRQAYALAGLKAEVLPFIDDMARRLRAADLVVCRAGATTLAEITAAGKAAILIPLPTATDDHQRKNAEALASHGAAEVLLQAHATGEVLAQRIASLIADPARRGQLGRAARAQARPDAARAIVTRSLELVGAR